MIKFQSAPKYYRLLNGILCIFKHEGEGSQKIVEKLQVNLSRDLNSLLCYNFDTIENESKQDFSTCQLPLPDVSAGTSHELQNNELAQKETDLVRTKRVIDVNNEYKLIFGERYIPSDIKMSFVDGLSKHSSGVLLLGLGNFGRQSMRAIAHSKHLRVYHVKGRLGVCTDNFSPKGKFMERAGFRHVTQDKLGKVCATAQAAFSREMYSYSGVSPDSQDAYEMAASGIIRPAERHTPPVLYGIKCVHFQPPDFTLEVHAINENCLFMRKMIHDMAIQLKTRAVCTGIRRLRYGHFGVDRALVRSQWSLENIVNNIEINQDLLAKVM